MNTESSSETALPALRQGLEAVQIDHEGQPMIVLKDQEGITQQAVALSLPGFLVATLLNGQHKTSEIQAMFAKTTGAVITAAEIQNLVSQLDQAELLETEGLQEKRKKVWQDFLDSPVRKPHHMGGGYPDKPLDLAIYLGKFFKDPKGPGREIATAPEYQKPLLGLFSPHIDFNRGGPAYAWAYQALSKYPRPDLIVGLGVAHMSPNSPWVMTRKSYETPYGPLSIDAELYESFKKTLWYEPDADEWAHRTEHSLEFQALWLKYLWRDNTPPWVPILCSSFYHFCPDRPPSAIPTIEGALQQMGAMLKERRNKGQKISILAGVDLAHVGPRFGDNEALGPELNERIEKEDKKSIDLALQLKADEFYMSVVQDGHWRKMCGLSAIYTAARLMKIMAGDEPVRGEMLSYGLADDPMGGVVSFTSVVFPAS